MIQLANVTSPPYKVNISQFIQWNVSNHCNFKPRRSGLSLGSQATSLTEQVILFVFLPMHYWLWTSREAWFIKEEGSYFCFLYFQTNLQATTDLYHISIHKFQILPSNTDSMQYWPLSIKGGHSLPCQRLHKLLLNKTKTGMYLTAHLPLRSFCALSAHTRCSTSSAFTVTPLPVPARSAHPHQQLTFAA